MKKILFSLAFSVLMVVLLQASYQTTLAGTVFAADETVVAADSKIFTLDELAKFDGLDGHKSYTAYEGVVYDVTDSKLWKEGEHFGFQAGVDLTGKMTEAPHGAEAFMGFQVIGKLEGYAQENVADKPVETKSTLDADKLAETTEASAVGSSSQAWYEKRIRIGSFSILGWTGIILGVFFALTFASCFALPWAKLPLPWKGSKIGPDPLDDADKHMTWSSIHKHFVWVTVVFGIIHGIIGFLQMMGIYL